MTSTDEDNTFFLNEKVNTEIMCKRVGRPRGRRSSLLTSIQTPRRQLCEEKIESIISYKSLDKEQLLEKAKHVPSGLSLFDVFREPRKLTNDSIHTLLNHTVRLSDTGLTEDLSCPICMGTYQHVAVVKDCLHRFCEECIERWLRTGHQDCPKCRQRIPSRRSLRADPIFQKIVQRLFPNVQEFEQHNDRAVASANRRRVGLELVEEETRPRRGRASKESIKQEVATNSALTTAANSPFIEVQLLPQSEDLEFLKFLKVRPSTASTIQQLINMIQCAAADSQKLNSMKIHLSLPSTSLNEESLEPLENSTVINTLLTTTNFVKADQNNLAVSVLTLRVWHAELSK